MSFYPRPWFWQWRGAPLPLLVEHGNVVEDVKAFIYPALLLFRPPGFVVIKRDTKPAIEALLKTIVVPGVVAPVQEFQQFVAGEEHLSSRSRSFR